MLEGAAKRSARRPALASERMHLMQWCAVLCCVVLCVRVRNIGTRGKGAPLLVPTFLDRLNMITNNFTPVPDHFGHLLTCPKIVKIIENDILVRSCDYD